MRLMKAAFGGVLSALLLMGAALAQATPQEVTITLSSYAITPNAITLATGAPAVLHLVNSAGKDHNFSAPEFFAASAIAPADAEKVKKGTVEVPVGERVDVTVTPSTAGTYKSKCTHPFHTTLGMKGTITVQ